MYNHNYLRRHNNSLIVCMWLLASNTTEVNDLRYQLFCAKRGEIESSLLPPVEKYRKLLKKTKQARLGQIILSGILPVSGNRIQGYRNSKRMAVNGMVERLCQEEDVGYVDMWDSFVGNEELYFRDGLHLSGKGAAVLAEGL